MSHYSSGENSIWNEIENTSCENSTLNENKNMNKNGTELAPFAHVVVHRCWCCNRF